MAADIYDREQELITMMIYEGLDYTTPSIPPESQSVSQNIEITEQRNNDVSTILQNLEQVQKEVSRIHGALFHPLQDKQKDLEERLTASTLADSMLKKKNKQK